MVLNGYTGAEHEVVGSFALVQARTPPLWQLSLVPRRPFSGPATVATLPRFLPCILGHRHCSNSPSFPAVHSRAPPLWQLCARPHRQLPELPATWAISCYEPLVDLIDFECIGTDSQIMTYYNRGLLS